MATLIACGLDPERCILFRQSDVPYHTQLCWILSTLTTMNQLGKVPTFREKSAELKRRKEHVMVGLYLYPLLQTADILLYKSTHVPVGQDQLQHIYLARHLAEKFNLSFAVNGYFPIPEAILSKSEAAIRIKSLRNPKVKMSKSDDSHKSRIELLAPSDTISMNIKKAVTDFTSQVTYEPEKRPGVSNLLQIHSLISGKSIDTIVEENKSRDTGQYKSILAEEMIEFLKPIQLKTQELLHDTTYIDKLYQKGAEKANSIAAQTFDEINEIIGFYPRANR